MPQTPPDESEALDRDLIRAARIAALRKSIAAGTYEIPVGSITDKLIEDMSRRP